MNHTYLKELKNLKLFDDDFARIVFKDKNCVLELAKALDIIDEDEDIIHFETQYDIKNISEKSVMLDIMIISDKKHIDIELENHESNALAKRIRMYASEIDVNILRSGQPYKKLPHTIIVEICGFDPFDKGLPVYTVKRKIEELSKDFDDESLIMLVNGDYNHNDKIGRLVHDLKCTNPDEMHNEVLKERVRYFKETKGGVKQMCEIWDNIKADGIKIGEAIGEARGEAKGEARGEAIEKLETVSKLINKMNMSFDEALEFLEITKEDYDRYQKLLEDNN